MSLTIKNLRVVAQKKEILHGIDLEIREGEFISLLGASGCGKTTLLKSIAGLLDIAEGDIRIRESSVIGIAPEKRGTVIVFQDLRLFPHMTAGENIAFSMELQNVPKKIQREAVKHLLEEVQLAGFERRRLREMSGGQLQRVALARALAANPSVLLLDEPFSGLDESLRLEMGRLVKKIHAEKKITTVLVTHDKKQALQMSDRIALMDAGRILQYDTPQNIFQHPVSKTVAEYFGKVNYVEGRIENHRFRSAQLEMDAACEDGDCEAMIRPASVHIVRGSAYMIAEIAFMGETAEVKVAGRHGSMVSRLMSDALTRAGLQVGDTVDIAVEEAGVTWLRKEEDRA